jgi:hypothetical protein
MGQPPNRPNPARASHVPGFTEVDSMPVIETDLKPTPSIIPTDVLDMSDDECVARLAEIVREPNLEHLDEMARLIARLAVTME